MFSACGEVAPQAATLSAYAPLVTGLRSSLEPATGTMWSKAASLSPRGASMHCAMRGPYGSSAGLGGGPPPQPTAQTAAQPAAQQPATTGPKCAQILAKSRGIAASARLTKRGPAHRLRRMLAPRLLRGLAGLEPD